MDRKFEIVFGSPLDYNDGVVYLYYNEKPLCLINKEKGKENLEIEFFQEENIVISLKDFENMLKSGIEEILKDSPYM